MALDDLVARRSRASSNPGVVLTFDDGYGDNLHVARPLLERHAFPATVFVTSGYVGRRREFWWDELERILLVSDSLPDTLRLSIGTGTHVWELGDSGHERLTDNDSWNLSSDLDPTARHSIYRFLCSCLRRLSVVDRESVLEELRRWGGMDTDARSSHLPLTADELRELANGGLVDIGAHTAEHPALAGLSVPAQREEVRGSKRYLEDVLGHRVAHFSYPFGRGRRPRRTYTKQTVKLVQEAGYSAACALKPAWAPRSNMYELPRLIVHDWDGDELLRRIRIHNGRPQSLRSSLTRNRVAK